MATFTDPTSPTWPDIYILAETDPVEGGPDGVDNLPHKQLAERSAYLKAELEGVASDVAGHAASISALSATTSAAFGRAYALEMDYNDEGFNFELFSTPDALSFRDFDSIAVDEVTNGDDTLDVANTSLLQEGESYILTNADGRFVQAFDVDKVLTATRLRAKSNFTTSFVPGSGATVRRSTWLISDGSAVVRDADRLYSRVLKALHYWDQGHLVIRRGADGTGTFDVRYRATGTEAWATADRVSVISRLAGTRDETHKIGIGGDIELRIDYAGADASDTDTVHHLVLYTPPRSDTLSAVQQPVNTSPTNEATNVGQTPTLEGSTFRSIYGLSQSGAQFQVARDASFSDILLNTSTDFLASWIAITQSESAADLNALAMQGDGLATVVGNAGAIIATDDGGDTWTAETAAGSANFHCVAQTSTMRIAGGATGTLEQSTFVSPESGWGAWSALTPAGSYANTIRGIAVQGANIVFVGDGGEIQTSNDGGTFFAARTAADSFSGQFNAVAMDGAGKCIAVGAAGTIQTSPDFGLTWVTRSPSSSYAGAFTAVSMDETGNALIVGETGEVQTTNDFGATWTQRTTADTGAFTGTFNAAVLAADENAIIVGAAGEIQTSDDGGITWYQRTAAGAFAGIFGGVDIDGNGDALIVGASGEVQKANRLDTASTSFTVPAGDDMLQTGSIYWWRCRYQDADSNWSPWSGITAFATSAVFDYVVQPSAISPASGATGVSLLPTLTASAFEYVGAAVTHAKSQWRISLSSDFSTIAYNSGESDDLESHTLPGGSELAVDSAYYWQVRYKDSDAKWSGWSVPVGFQSAKKPNAPSITAPTAGATGVLETPTLESSLFSTPAPDTQVAAQWRISATSGDYAAPVWDSGTVGSLTSITVPSGVLSDGETVYYVQVRHQGNELGWSDWSEESSFTTATAFWDPYDAANAGTAREGGYFVGVITQADGDYELIIAPKSSEATLQHKTTNDATSGTESYHDGLSNSTSMNNASHPAAQHCLAGTWGGQSDWYLPARDEFELCYRNLKPTTAANQTGGRPESGNHGENANSNPVGAAYTTSDPARTAALAFQEGGSEALDGTGTWYWTSTQYAPFTGSAWIQICSDGYQNSYTKLISILVRPVRRLKI